MYIIGNLCKTINNVEMKEQYNNIKQFIKPYKIANKNKIYQKQKQK
jgi:hypothetical protein